MPTSADRDGLLAAVAADPDDDVPRLVLADYLDERGDPLGEFIRLQMALEPLRIPRADPAGELERHKRLAGIPPGGDWRVKSWEVARQIDREADLRRMHQAEWLGEAAPLLEESAHWNPEFRRGFVASAQVGLTALGDCGVAVRRSCPTLQRLIVLGTLGRGEELASCPALAGLPALTLAGWLTAEDATAVARSRHLKGLRSLTVWIGNQGEEEAIPTLAGLKGLRELTLVQLYGGLNTEGEDPEAFDEHAEGLAETVRRLRPDCRVSIERPFARRFPLDGRHVGRGLDAGHLPDGQAVLIVEGRQAVLMRFDEEGFLAGEELLDLRARLKQPRGKNPRGHDREELLALLEHVIGFVPGPIFVREFTSTLSDVQLHSFAAELGEINSPRTTDPEEGEEIAHTIYWWFSTSQFVLPFGNHNWANGLGRIHSDAGV